MARRGRVPQVGKLVYCTRTVPEMEKVLVELQVPPPPPPGPHLTGSTWSTV